MEALRRAKMFVMHNRGVLDATEVTGWFLGGYVDTILEVLGIFIAGLAGGLAGVRKNFDVFGVIVIAWAASLGGGLLRDVMIGAIPPVGISSPLYIATAIVSGIAIFLFHPNVERMRRSIVILDAWALSIFVLLGAYKGLSYDVGILASVVSGLLTGVGGGVLRDILVDEVPLLLVDRQYYALPALAGSVMTVVLWVHGWLNVWTQLGVIALIAGFRLLALRMKWVIPQANPARRSQPWGQRRAN